MEDLVTDFGPGFGPGFAPLHALRAAGAQPEDTDRNPAETGGDGAVDGTSQLYGACSVETSRAAGALHAAHRDAEGFLDAVDGFATAEFWRRDIAVKSWIYDRRDQEHAPGRDMDSVRVFYHAGHGRMDEHGNFHLPMGALWSGADGCLSSDRMRFGGNALRYLFWSASQSLRVGAGHSPARSWGLANAGARMLFGFDSICWDSGQYGRNFWRHWDMGKSFSQAWLDGCWDVAADQGPVVTACGASRDEALATLFDDRHFRAAPASGAWWAWRWHVPTALIQREPGPSHPPPAFSAVRLVPVAEDLTLAAEVLAHIDEDPALLRRQGDGSLSLHHGSTRFQRRADGRILLELARSTPGEGRLGLPLQGRAILNRARGALRRYGFLHRDYELVFDRVSLAMSATTSLRRADEPAVESLDEIVVQYRQAFGGLPVLTPDAGGLRLTMRPDGTVLRIESTLRRMAEQMPARAHRNGLPGDPPPPAGADAPAEAEPPAIGQLLALRSARLMRDLAARGAAPLNLGVLPGTTEIGYGIRSNTARLVAREAIEIECRRGFRKRYWIQSDLGD